MTKAPNRITPLLHPLGVAGPARVRAFDGTAAPSPRRTPLALLTLAVLCATLGGLALSAAPALAAHVLSSSFGGPCVVKPLEPCEGKFSGPSGVAVNEETGDVYVVDKGNNRVEEFNSAGSALLGEFNGAAAPTGALSEPDAIAIDNSTNPLDPSKGDVYVADVGASVVYKFSAGGVYEGQFAKGSLGFYGELDGVAVDPGGVVWISRRNSTGNPEIESYSDALSNERLSGSQIPTIGGGGAGQGFAVDSEDNLYVGDFYKIFSKRNSSGQTLIEAVDAEESTGAAVDEFSNDVYIDNVTTVAEFSPAGSELDRFGAGELTAGSGVAVDSATNTVYVADSAASTVSLFVGPVSPAVTTGEATGLQVEGSATLNGTVDPRGIPLSSCEFEYISAATVEEFVKEGFTAEIVLEYLAPRASCEHPGAEEIPVDSAFHAVHADVSGLTPANAYDFRLVAANADGSEPGAGKALSFFATTSPLLSGAAAADLAASSATLHARVNPEGLPTAYRFEYGTTSAYGTSVPVPDGEIPAGTSAVTVSEHIEGLSPDTTYHWRILASNADGTAGASSVDHTFLYDTSGAGLPDGRSYEMVTPPQKNGALLGDVTFVGLGTDIAADGSRVIASAIQCFAGAGSCNGHHGDAVGSPYQFERTGSGWVTTPLAPPASEFTANAPWGYSASAGTALFSMASAPFGEDDFYVREADGSFRDIGPNTPPEEGAQGPIGGKAAAEVQASTADFSHVVWQTPARWPFDEGNPGGTMAYEYAGVGNAQPLLVGVSGGYENGENHNLISVCGTHLGAARNIAPPGMLSADGRTVIFTALTEDPGVPCASGSGANDTTPVPADAVYARVDGELADAHTVAVSDPSPSECGGGAGAGEVACREAVGKPANAEFSGASSDGSKVFFTSTQQLTDGASEDSNTSDNATLEGGCTLTVGVNGCDLYEYDFGNPAGRELVDVSGGDVSGGGPRVQGVMALSPDGSHVYFVAKGVLSTVANDREQSATDGANNLYLFERDEAFPAGRTVFITDLPTSDNAEWDEQPGLPANVTPEGRFLMFVSSGELTADDTSVSGAKQVFRYDAQTGVLSRVSIGNDGFGDDGNRSIATPCNSANECSEDAHIVPATEAKGGFERSDPSMSDDGSRVFFQSPLALTAHALNDVPIGGRPGEPLYAQNVYEWEQQGVGSCPPERTAGCVFLISDGQDVSVDQGQESLCPVEGGASSSVCLLGTDVSGSNVFFSTVDRLVGQDTDTELDYYDARVCAREGPCLNQSAPASTECEGETCQGAPGAPPSQPAPASSTFNGPGNLAAPPALPVAKPTTVAQIRAEKLAKALKACHKDKKKAKRVKCEKSARKLYGKASKAKKSNDKRRTSK